MRAEFSSHLLRLRLRTFAISVREVMPDFAPVVAKLNEQPVAASCIFGDTNAVPPSLATGKRPRHRSTLRRNGARDCRPTECSNGRRVEKRNATQNLRYVYSGSHLIAEVDTITPTVAQKIYRYYPGVDRPHSVKLSSGTFYYLFAIGTPGVVGVIDSTGTIKNHYRYSPWGALEDSIETAPNVLKFGGREYDNETHLYYNRARYYDPQLARFLSEDPIGQNGGANQYAYAGNNPIGTMDPSGTFACEGVGDPYEADGWWGECSPEADGHPGDGPGGAPTCGDRGPVSITGGAPTLGFSDCQGFEVDNSTGQVLFDPNEPPPAPANGPQGLITYCGVSLSAVLGPFGGTEATGFWSAADGTWGSFTTVSTDVWGAGIGASVEVGVSQNYSAFTGSSVELCGAGEAVGVCVSYNESGVSGSFSVGLKGTASASLADTFTTAPILGHLAPGNSICSMPNPTTFF